MNWHVFPSSCHEWIKWFTFPVGRLYTWMCTLLLGNATRNPATNEIPGVTTPWALVVRRKTRLFTVWAAVTSSNPRSCRKLNTISHLLIQPHNRRVMTPDFLINLQHFCLINLQSCCSFEQMIIKPLYWQTRTVPYKGTVMTALFVFLLCSSFGAIKKPNGTRVYNERTQRVFIYIQRSWSFFLFFSNIIRES